MARTAGGSGRPRPTCASASPAAWRACESGWERPMIETDDFLADLERYLHDAAQRRDVARPRERVRRRGLAGLALVAALAVVAIALVRVAPSSPPDDRAIATPSASPSPHVEAQGQRLASLAVRD